MWDPACTWQRSICPQILDGRASGTPALVRGLVRTSAMDLIQTQSMRQRKVYLDVGVRQAIDVLGEKMASLLDLHDKGSTSTGSGSGARRRTATTSWVLLFSTISCTVTKMLPRR